VGDGGNGELARRGFELWNERDFDELLTLFHENAAWDGHDGLTRFYAEWLQAFPDSSIEVEDVEEVGERTLTIVLQIVSGGASGTPVPFKYAGIGHWRDGRLDFVENHADLERARIAFHSYSTTDERIPARNLDT
jgi:hypothetical protein